MQHDGSTRFSRIEALVDGAMDLPADEREAFFQRCTEDADVIAEAMRLLERMEPRQDLFERPLSSGLITADAGGIAPGTRIGAWCVLELVGRGGMGEVHRAERADGTFQQQVALKVVRREAVDQTERFHEERRLLARLDHPGIARVLDGGVTPDGRPWMAMEWVEGELLSAWCARRPTLAARLDIFVQVCDAVAYAHRNLLVHRDLKPANVLVTAEGRAKLLDFGVAKLLTGAADETRTHAPMTMAYAAPEQLGQEAITTATDVYALGLMLFELLTGERPWHRADMQLPTLLFRQLNEAPPLASATAARSPSAPVPARLLRGDLDAIVGYAMRLAPERRYRSAAEMADDLRRHLEGRPVVARPESLAYTFASFVRRNRLAAGFAGVAVAALVIGLAVALWQAQAASRAADLAQREAARAQQEAARAQREATRATATKDFLVRVFRASDPRIAQDKPRGQITAKELLDLNAPKIREDFKDDPDTQIELLGVAASIYGEFADKARFQALQTEQVELARRTHGDTHPAVVEALLTNANHAVDETRSAEAVNLLAQADVLIRKGSLDRTAQRARWWLVRARSLMADPESAEEYVAALENAVNLYAETAPQDARYVLALALLGHELVGQAPARAVPVLERALEADRHTHDRDDTLLAAAWRTLALARNALGQYELAAKAFERAHDIYLKTYGPEHWTYWEFESDHAAFVHQSGDRPRALGMFERLLAGIPADWTTNTSDEYAREVFAVCLAAEGRARQAIPILERAERAYLQNSGYHSDLRRVRLYLGDAYDRAGRTEEARRSLKASLDDFLTVAAPDHSDLLVVRERWGRFLLSHQEVAAGEEQLREVLARSRADPTSEAFALAQGGLARVALLRGDAAAALAASQDAVDTFARITGGRDVRTGPYLWLIHAQALHASGDGPRAREWARRALEASRRYDDPAASSVVEAEAMLRGAS
ncbi:MAG TPA: protein kinase [Nevskiaceae bacterium]|nr:protein kinase [Nevskiaceae bacterium]